MPLFGMKIKRHCVNFKTEKTGKQRTNKKENKISSSSSKEISLSEDVAISLSSSNNIYVDIHYDDSSDEEDTIEFDVKEQFEEFRGTTQFNELNGSSFYCKENSKSVKLTENDIRFSFLSHALGLLFFHSKKVNENYYELKKQYLEQICSLDTFQEELSKNIENVITEICKKYFVVAAADEINLDKLKGISGEIISERNALKTIFKECEEEIYNLLKDLKRKTKKFNDLSDDTKDQLNDIICEEYVNTLLKDKAVEGDKMDNAKTKKSDYYATNNNMGELKKKAFEILGKVKKDSPVFETLKKKKFFEFYINYLLKEDLKTRDSPQIQRDGNYQIRLLN